MKDFAGSSITYYGLAREKVMKKYPRLISILMILALICMTGLAIFLISDLVSFASNPDHKGVLVGLDLKGPENGIVSMTNGKEKSGNIGANSSPALENLSRQTKEQNSSNLSQINQAAKGVIAASKSSSSSSTVKKHHSSAKSAKKSNDTNNLTNETAKSQIANSSNLSDERQRSILSERSNDSEVESAAIPASLPSVAIGGITNPAEDTSARVPVSIIKFKTQATLSPKSEQGLNSGSGDSGLSSNSGMNTDSGANADKQVNANGATVSDNSNNAQSASMQKSKVTASSHAQKTQEARAKQIANRDRMAENMKKKAAQSRAKAASK